MRNVIPEHTEGKRLDCFETLEFANESEATLFYETAKRRLLDIGNWAKITDIPSATFSLMDANNNKLHRLAAKGDYVRIDIPGPGLPSSGGYDWVVVEDIAEEAADGYQRTVIRLRPQSDPTNDNPDTAHFFTASATSTLIVEQRSNSVFAQYAGRNEIINDENADLTDRLRNFLVGVGAKMGASFPQWKALVAAIVQRPS